MVKPVKLVEEKERIQNLSVTFDEGQPDAGHYNFIYDVEVFEDIAGYQVNGDLVGITKKDGGNIVIPMRRIRSIETSFVNKE